MIIAWVDPKGRTYPLDHPDLMQVLGMPPAILDDIVKHEAEDTRHSGTNLTVTGPIGCARQLAISRMLDTVVDPQILWPTVGGTYLHTNFGEIHADYKDSAGYQVWYTEERNPEKCTVSGTVRGREVSAKLDLVSANIYDWIDYDGIRQGPYGDNRKAIWDWKTSFNKGHSFAGKEKVGSQWVWTGKAKEQHIVQLNLGRMLLEQTLDIDLTDVEMVAWICSGKWVATKVPWMGLDQVMALKPGGKVYTYGFMFDEVNKMFDKWREAAIPYGGDIDAVPLEVRLEIIRDMPLYGLHLFNNRYGGNACSDYCPFKWQCDQINGGI